MSGHYDPFRDMEDNFRHMEAQMRDMERSMHHMHHDFTNFDASFFPQPHPSPQFFYNPAGMTFPQMMPFNDSQFNFQPNLDTFMSNMNGHGTYTSASYTMSSGPNGTYSSNRTVRGAPGQIHEVYETVEDADGQRVTIERGIGDRSRRITRTRDRQGQEQTRDLLTNVDMDQTEAFDEEWNRASGTLPRAVTSRHQRRLQ